MTKPFENWTVLPHGRITRVEDNILTVTGMLHMPPMGQVQRRMTVVRLHDDRLIIYSAIALDEEEMIELETFGMPTYLIVPNDIHRMDAKIWKQRYPELIVITPAGARPRVESVVPVQASEVDFGDPSVRLLTVPGTGGGEAALVIDNASGTTLVLNDLIFNLANRPGIRGWLFKKLGMTGDEPHIPPVIKLRQIKDERLLRAQLERWAELPRLKRVLVSHGDIVADAPAQVLRRIAKRLAA
jgi:hypothetical protein